jgi:hypothetical protein
MAGRIARDRPEIDQRKSYLEVGKQAARCEVAPNLSPHADFKMPTVNKEGINCPHDQYR